MVAGGRWEVRLMGVSEPCKDSKRRLGAEGETWTSTGVQHLLPAHVGTQCFLDSKTMF